MIRKLLVYLGGTNRCFSVSFPVAFDVNDWNKRVDEETAKRRHVGVMKDAFMHESVRAVAPEANMALWCLRKGVNDGHCEDTWGGSEGCGYMESPIT